MKKVKLLLTIALMLLPLYGWTATVYVSNSTANGWATGNDSNTYTQSQSTATPWLTLTKAVTSCVNGDTIVMNDGTYAEAV